ncbi:hypothetical protein D3C85_1367810 [compost metagenome]
MALICIYANDKLTDDVLGAKCLLDDVIRHESFLPVIDELNWIAMDCSKGAPVSYFAREVINLFVYGGLSLTHQDVANMTESNKAKLVLSMIGKIRDDENPVSALFAIP